MKQVLSYALNNFAWESVVCKKENLFSSKHAFNLNLRIEMSR